MSQLPLIVGFGGINPAGRTSFHHGYRRLIIDTLDEASRKETLLGLATLTGLASYSDSQYRNQAGEAVDVSELLKELEPQLLNNTLIRQIEPECFDTQKVMQNTQASLKPVDGILKFTLRKRQMPKAVPENWEVETLEGGQFAVTVHGQLDVILPDTKVAQVQAAGQLPTGFEPDSLYQSRNHPRNLQMSIFAASDALRSSGIPFSLIADKVAPDEIGVYASNSIGQLDDFGFGGLGKYPALGKRTTSKQMPLGYAQMPADFVNAYVLGSVGVTGGALGACATFLYNLKNAVHDIRSGARKVVLVGGSDAPVIPEIIEGFRVMGALAEDKDLLALNQVSELVAEHYRSACRPFGENCGFTIGESSQFVMLMADDLALELGAQVFGSVPDVFVNADGHKKSISAPGVGNYITLTKAASLVRSMLGDKALKERSFVQAHGTSTPQNRVTESHVINETAKAFGISQWPVAAIKAYIGHSQGTAGGDQLAASLGTWKYGYIPGITTTPSFADDVYQSNLLLSKEHLDVGTQGMDAVLLNSKGFGGNNASAPVLSPSVTLEMLKKRHGEAAMTEYANKLELVEANAARYDAEAIKGNLTPIYHYDHDVLGGEHLEITDQEIRLPGYHNPVNLKISNPFDDMC